MRSRWTSLAMLAALALGGCRSGGEVRPGTPGEPLPAESGPLPAESGPPPLPVKKASEEVVVAAWSEPKQLPQRGGQVQVLVRAQKRGGAPFAGVEVRIQAEGGTLFSKGRVLTTDGSGRTRDRLTARGDASITVNAGGTVYRFQVPVRAPAAAAAR